MSNLASKIIAAQSARIAQMRDSSAAADLTNPSGWGYAFQLDNAAAVKALPAVAAEIAAEVEAGQRFAGMAAASPAGEYRAYLRARASVHYEDARMIAGNPGFAGVGFGADEFIPR